jgi:hypothetical protein
LGGRERIKLKTTKDFVSVLIEQGLSKHFGKSVGLMGDFGMGRMMARDGKSILDDANAFGQDSRSSTPSPRSSDYHPSASAEVHYACSEGNQPCVAASWKSHQSMAC